MHDLGIRGFYCMTFSNYTGHTVAGGAGPCIYETHITESSEFYHPLPHIVSELNSDICGPLHRTGQLCGHCKKGYKRPAYFYGYKCVLCNTNIKYNWLKYISIAFAPLTFFLFSVLFQDKCHFSSTECLHIFQPNVFSTSDGARCRVSRRCYERLD